MKRKRAVTTASACLLAAAMFAGGAYAYLTDTTQEQKKSYTVGHVSVSLDGNIADTGVMACKDKKEFAPTVTNTGSVPAYVFVRVKVPTGSYHVVNDQGKVSKDEVGELFTFLTGTGNETADTCNSNWIEISNENNTHVYAYKKKLDCTENSNTTEPLFDQIMLKNFDKSGTGTGKEEEEIQMVCSAIQSDNLGIDINGKSDADLKAELGKIYSIIVEQNKGVQAAATTT